MAEGGGDGVGSTCVVVPAGGGARRLGGIDKPSAPLAGRPLLEHLLAGLTGPGGLPAGVAVAVVGPARTAAAECTVLPCREEPPGGGPAAAVGAGVAALEADGLLAGVVVVLPGDAPWSPAAVPVLLEALRGHPGAATAVAVDAGGRRQVLVAAHRTGPLQQRLARLRAGGGGLVGVPASRLLPADAELVEVPVEAAVVADVDTPQDLAAARAAAAAREARPGGPA